MINWTAGRRIMAYQSGTEGKAGSRLENGDAIAIPDEYRVLSYKLHIDDRCDWMRLTLGIRRVRPTAVS